MHKSNIVKNLISQRHDVLYKLGTVYNLSFCGPFLKGEKRFINSTVYIGFSQCGCLKNDLSMSSQGIELAQQFHQYFVLF